MIYFKTSLLYALILTSSSSYSQGFKVFKNQNNSEGVREIVLSAGIGNNDYNNGYTLISAEKIGSQCNILITNSNSDLLNNGIQPLNSSKGDKFIFFFKDKTSLELFATEETKGEAGESMFGKIITLSTPYVISLENINELSKKTIKSCTQYATDKTIKIKVKGKDAIGIQNAFRYLIEN